jgi:hypothetical protein
VSWYLERRNASVVIRYSLVSFQARFAFFGLRRSAAVERSLRAN